MAEAGRSVSRSIADRAIWLARPILCAGYMAFGGGLAAVLIAADGVAGFAALAAGAALTALVRPDAGAVRPRVGLGAMAAGAVFVCLGLAARSFMSV